MDRILLEGRRVMDGGATQGEGHEDRASATVRDQVRAAVETGIAFLLHERDQDAERPIVRRLVAA